MPTPATAKGGPSPKLSTKAGPLPVWAWALVAGGVAFVFLMLTRRSQGGATSGAAVGNGEINGALAGAPRENGVLANSLDPSIVETLLGQFLTDASGGIQAIVAQAQDQLASQHPTHAHGGAGGKKVPKGGSASHGGASSVDQSGWPGPGSGYLPGGAINPFTGEYTEPQVYGKIVCLGGNCDNSVVVPWGPGTPVGFGDVNQYALQYGVPLSHWPAPPPGHKNPTR